VIRVLSEGKADLETTSKDGRSASYLAAEVTVNPNPAAL